MIPKDLWTDLTSADEAVRESQINVMDRSVKFVQEKGDEALEKLKALDTPETDVLYIELASVLGVAVLGLTTGAAELKSSFPPRAF